MLLLTAVYITYHVCYLTDHKNSHDQYINDGGDLTCDTYDDTHSSTSDNDSSQSLHQQGLQVNGEGGGAHESVQQKLHQLRVPEEGGGRLIHSLGGRRLGQQQHPVM